MQRPFGAYRGEGPYLFVSYAHDDADIVFPQLVWLKDQGFNIWYDEGIEAGTEWREEIARAIRNAQVFVYFVTPRSAESDNCKKEVHYAVDRQTPVIAVHLQPTELPDGIDLAISDRQAIMQHEIGESASRIKLLERASAYVGGAGLARSRQPDSSGKRRWIPLTAAALIVAVAVVWYFPLDGGRAPDPINALSIAVLPFTNSSPAGGVDFTGGLRDDVLNALNGREYCGLMDCNAVRVASGAASDRFGGPDVNLAAAARELSVAYFLNGTVRRNEDRVRISVELTRGVDGTQVWSKTYERTLDEDFGVPRSLATNIAHLATNKLGFDVDAAHAPDLPRFAGVEPEALQHFMDSADELRNVNLDGSGSLQLRIQMLNRALQIDPDFALARLYLGGMYAFRLGLPLAEAREQAHFHLNAVKDIEFSEVALEAATIHTLLDLDYAEAERLLEKALSGTPRWEAWQHFWRARVALREGRKEDALRYLQNSRSFQAGYEQSNFIGMSSWLYVAAGEYESAVELSAEGLDLTEGGLGRTLILRSRYAALLALGRDEEAREIVAELEGIDPPEVMAPAYAWLGDREKTRAILERRSFEDMPFGRWFFVALAYTNLGELNNAFEVLKAAILNHDQLTVDSLRLFEFWDPLRDDPRFDELLDLLSSLETHTPAYLSARDRG